MSILGRLALLFIGVPLLELVLLIQLGQWIGLWPTLGIVVLTGVAGATLARMEGMRTLWSFRGELARGPLPPHAIFDGLAILVGGALLLTPGLLTDVVGFSLLLPPPRRWIQGRIRKRLEEQLKDGTMRISVIQPFPMDNDSGMDDDLGIEG